MREYFITEDGDYLSINKLNGHGWKENCFPREHIDISTLDINKLKKIKKHKYLTELNNIHKHLKIQWEYNGSKFRRLNCFELNEYGNIENYFICNTERTPNDIKTNKPIVPYSKFKEYTNYGMVVMFRGKVIIVTPYTNGGYCSYDIRTREFIGWVTITNCAPIMNMATKKIIGINDI